MTDRIRTAIFVWTEDDVMVPLPRFKTMCVRQFAVGEEYALGPVEQVSSGSRGGFFAELRNIYDSLPETDTRFPSFTHFRKVALVNGGWATHSHEVLDTPMDARKHARGIRRHDEYAIIRISGRVVDVWVAKSIGHGQIKDHEWKEVKPKALAWARAQVGVTKSESEQHMEQGGAV